jgi:hypothetical protein
MNGESYTEHAEWNAIHVQLNCNLICMMPMATSTFLPYTTQKLYNVQTHTCTVNQVIFTFYIRDLGANYTVTVIAE